MPCNGININVRSWGVGEPLLLVHGLGMSSDLWFNQIPAFSARYRVHAVDLRGFGRSDKPSAAGAYAIEVLAEDIAAVIRGLGPDPVHFVGTSMGGYIGVQLAISSPSLCRSLSLCHTGYRSSISPEVFDSRLAALKTQTMEAYAPLVAGQALAQPARPANTEWLQEHLARNDQRAYTQVLAEGLRGFDASPGLADITLPTLVIVGEQDRVIPPVNGRNLSSKIPGAQLVEIAGVGHLSYMEEPEKFNQSVLAFLSAH
jgi:3-oxoadipate enol-lactonase